MRRRDLMALVGSTAVSWPLGAHAQQRAMPVVGVLNMFSRPPAPWEPGQGPVADGLREAAYIAGQNVTFEYRFAERHYDLLPTLAADLVAQKVDVIVAIYGTPPALAAKTATATTSPLAWSWSRGAKAASISPSVPAFNTESCIPFAAPLPACI